MTKSTFITLVSILFAAVSSCFAQNDTAGQTVYVDGILRIKLVDSYSMDFKVNEDWTINVEEIPFLKKMAKKYGIASVRQDFRLKNDPKLLHVLTIMFDNIDLTDKFIQKLEKNRNVEYVERVVIKKLMMKEPRVLELNDAQKK